MSELLYSDDYIDRAYPSHARTSCSDAAPINADVDGSGCHRCNALRFQQWEKQAARITELEAENARLSGEREQLNEQLRKMGADWLATAINGEAEKLPATRIKNLVEQHGSYRKVGELLGVDHAYLHRIAHGEKDNMSDDMLLKLGLRRGTFYAAIDTHSANTVGGPTPVMDAAPACEQLAELRVKMLWCASLEKWWNIASDQGKKKAYSASIEADAWKAKRIRELDEDLADVRGAAKTLEKVCDESLDMRPEFLSAVSRLHTAIANSERCPNCDCGDYQQFHHDGSRGTPECWWWECSSCGYKTQPE